MSSSEAEVQAHFSQNGDEAMDRVFCPVHVASVTAVGATKTRPSYLDREFDLIRLSKNHHELLQNIQSTQETLRDLKAFASTTIFVERVSDEEKASIQLEQSLQPALSSSSTSSASSAPSSTSSSVSASASVDPDAVWTKVYVGVSERQMPGISELMGKYDGKEFMASLDMKVPNFSGRFDTLDVQGEYGSRASNSLALHWTAPRFCGQRWGAAFGVHRRTQSRVAESSYQLLARGGSIGIKPFAGHTLAYNIDWRDVVPTPQSVDQRPPTLMGPSRSICLAAVPSVKSSISHSFERDRLDQAAVPTSGYAVSSRVEVAGPGGDVTHVRGQATLRAVLPITSWLSWHNAVRGGALYNWQTPKAPSCLPDRFLIGGPSSVRGFQEAGIGPRDRGDALGADVMVEGKSALEFDLPNRVLQSVGARAQLFVNAGNGVLMNDFQRDTFLSTMRVSAGVGLAVPGPLGSRIELNYTHVLRSQSGDRAVGAGWTGSGGGVQFGITMDAL